MCSWTTSDMYFWMTVSEIGKFCASQVALIGGVERVNSIVSINSINNNNKKKTHHCITKGT